MRGSLSPMRTFVVLLLMLVALLMRSATAATTLEQQREIFIAAEAALRLGQMERFQELQLELTAYPLYPYLVYAELIPRLDTASSTEVQAFLDDYRDTPLAALLRQRWLTILARQERHGEVLAFTPRVASREDQCRARVALLASGADSLAYADLEPLWLSVQTDPPACTALFEAWKHAGGLPPHRVWARIELAMADGHIAILRSLISWLSPLEQPWARLWDEVHERPELVLDLPRFTGLSPRLAAAVATHGIVRLARNDGLRAALAWYAHAPLREFTAIQRHRARRAVALELALIDHADALAWLGTLDMAQEDALVRERRVVVALRRGAWDLAWAWLNWLTPEEQASSQWRYWRARILGEWGFAREARALYQEIAQGRDLYAFLAADRLDVAYQIKNEPLRFSAQALTEVENLPAVTRARELYYVNHVAQARREWQLLLPTLTSNQQLRAARLAYSWGWIDRAILALAQAPRQNDLEMLFPLAYETELRRFAAAHNIPASWAFGILRQESAFVADVRSPAGALGLMQIMPNTGRQIAQALQTRLRDPEELLDPVTNIRYGTAYLRTMLDERKHIPLATAAYNAGSARVRRWLPRDQALPADIWLETIPFKETRDYVRRVLAYTIIYDRRLGGNLRLADILTPIEPADTEARP